MHGPIFTQKNDAWGSVDGFKSYSTTTIFGKVYTSTYTHSALSSSSDGDYQVRLAGTTEEVTLTKAEKYPSSITLNSGASVKLSYGDDLTVDYDAVRQQIWDNVVAATEPALTLDDVSIEYRATATTGLVQDWAALEGAKRTFTYPAMTEGTQKIRVSYAGDDTHSAVSAEVDVNVVGRSDVAYTLKKGPYEVGMVFNDDLSYNYAAVEQAIFDTVLESTEPEQTFDDVKIQYDANPISVDGVSNIWSSLDKGGANAFGPGRWKIRFSWNGTTEYKPGSSTVKVTVTDNRIASHIVFKEGAAITYNMEPEVMKQDLFQNAIDWSAATLPADASIDDFTFEYYAVDSVTGATRNWISIESGRSVLVSYPQMGAGGQQVRITYKGNAEYRPANDVEGAVTMKKATVKVSVHSTSIYADEAIPEGFVTLDPNDPAIDIYTIYVGLTSNVDACVYVQLPARLTDSAALNILDTIVAAFNDGKTLTQMMQEGMTVGELRALLSGLIDALNSAAGSSINQSNIHYLYSGITSSFRIYSSTTTAPTEPRRYTVTVVTLGGNYQAAPITRSFQITK